MAHKVSQDNVSKNLLGITLAIFLGKNLKTREVHGVNHPYQDFHFIVIRRFSILLVFITKR